MRDPQIQAAAQRAKEFHNGKEGFANADQRNIYQCEADPAHLIVTVDREPGVTPFGIACVHCKALGKATDRAGQTPLMNSGFYMAHPHLVPTHEWYRPESLEGLSVWEADHVLKGGLLFREIAKG